MELAACKDGEIQWKIHIFAQRTWITMFKCLASSMATEVISQSVPLNDLICIGREVALYVKDVYIKELTKLQSFKDRDYKKALEESFIRIDELLKSPQGLKDIKKYSSNETQSSMFG